jgi:hypothetical protein
MSVLSSLNMGFDNRIVSHRVTGVLPTCRYDLISWRSGLPYAAYLREQTKSG